MQKPVNQPAGMFPVTHWTSILMAGNHDDAQGWQALSRLLEKYRSPLLAHLKWRFHPLGESAEDWLHSFVEKKILEKELLKSAQKDRGRFRTFLVKALDNFVIDELRGENRDKRKPEGGFVAVDEMDTKDQLAFSPNASDPFDVAWGRAVLDQAVRRLRDFYSAKGRKDLWGVFDLAFLQPTLNESESPTMVELATRFGFTSASQASNGLVTAKRMFKQMLEDVIAEYVEDKRNIEPEMRELMAILAGAA